MDVVIASIRNNLKTTMDVDSREFYLEIGSEKHVHLATLISDVMNESANARGTGIGKKRPPELIANYIKDGKALLAFHDDGRWTGFCYMDTLRMIA